MKFQETGKLAIVVHTAHQSTQYVMLNYIGENTLNIIKNTSLSEDSNECDIKSVELCPTWFSFDG